MPAMAMTDDEAVDDERETGETRQTRRSLADAQRDLARDRILRAARSALAERGLATTIDEVADAAGVSRRTVFRHFDTRENLFAQALRDGLRSYGDRIGPSIGETVPPDGDLTDWWRTVLTAVHEANAHNGRIYWELSALGPQLTGELAIAATERRHARRRFARLMTTKVWEARGGSERPPAWLTDAVAVHLSGFTTQSLGGDFDRTPEQVADVAARVLTAAFADALGTRR